MSNIVRDLFSCCSFGEREQKSNLNSKAKSERPSLLQKNPLPQPAIEATAANSSIQHSSEADTSSSNGIPMSQDAAELTSCAGKLQSETEKEKELRQHNSCPVFAASTL